MAKNQNEEMDLEQDFHATACCTDRHSHGCGGFSLAVTAINVKQTLSVFLHHRTAFLL